MSIKRKKKKKNRLKPLESLLTLHSGSIYFGRRGTIIDDK
jgi:hypothetical protein